MKQQLVFNKLISDNWKTQDTIKLANKIKNIKSSTNNKCPESLIFRKNLRSQSFNSKIFL